MKTKREEWVVEVRYPRNDVVLTLPNGDVCGLVWGPWWAKSGPFAMEEEAKKEAEIVTRIEKETRSGAEVRQRRGNKEERPC